MKTILTAFLCLATSLTASAKEAPRKPASATAACGIVSKVGSSGGQAYFQMKDWDSRQSVRVSLNMKGDALTAAVSGAHASLNSMGKVFFCIDRASAEKDGNDLVLAGQSAFYTSLYADIQ